MGTAERRIVAVDDASFNLDAFMIHCSLYAAPDRQGRSAGRHAPPVPVADSAARPMT